MKGFVYKLCLNDDISKKALYVGSTQRDIKIRLGEHKSDIKIGRRLNELKELSDNLEIMLLEENEYIDTKNLRYRERYWCEKLKPQHNKCYAIRPKKEYNNWYWKSHKQELLKKRREKITCDKCGTIVSRRSILSHKSTNKCLEIQKKNEKNNNILVDNNKWEFLIVLGVQLVILGNKLKEEQKKQ